MSNYNFVEKTFKVRCPLCRSYYLVKKSFPGFVWDDGESISCYEPCTHCGHIVRRFVPINSAIKSIEMEGN